MPNDVPLNLALAIAIINGLVGIVGGIFVGRCAWHRPEDRLAAYQAGQRDMQERAAEEAEAWLGHRRGTINAIRALPIKETPDA